MAFCHTQSIVLPVHNAAKWLPECLTAITQQSCKRPIQLSAYDDASTDNSGFIIESWREKLQEHGVTLKISGHSGKPGGVGFAKNRCIAQSTGSYLCFQDADDVMHTNRIACQLETAKLHKKAIVGCQFHREPAGSTERFTQWANTLSTEQLYTQAYTSHGPTVIMPSWFCSRTIVEAVGGFCEDGKGTPEDLIFFYRHLELCGEVVRVNKDLLMYRYHPEAETFSISEQTIWGHRLQFLERKVLCCWNSFSIWNAGKQGRKFYRSLSPENRKKVMMFCDVDQKKIQKEFYVYEDSKERPKPKIPIVHFTAVVLPIVICVKMNLSGNFEQNLASLRLKEGRDYVHFN